MARKSVESFLRDCLTDPEKDGKKVTMIGLVQVQAAGGGVQEEIDVIRLGTTKEYDPKELADRLEERAKGHAQDLPGTQYFKILVFWGGAKTPEATMGYSVTAHPAKGDGIMSEAPTLEGQRAQGMRWTEGLLAQVYRRQQVLDEYTLRIIERLATDNHQLREENSDAHRIVHETMLNMAREQHTMRMTEMQFERSSAERKKMMQLAPALANQVFGRPIFPESTEDTAIMETIAEHITEDQLALLAGVLPKEVYVPLVTRFKTIMANKNAEKQEAHELAAKLRDKAPELTEGEAADDAAGDNVKPIESARQKQKGGKK